MTTKRPDRLAEVLGEIEALARRLRAELRRVARNTGLTKNLEQIAAALRKRAAEVAAQIEQYVHELRRELMRTPTVKRPAPRRKRAA